nr:hypothetical protein SUGSMm_22240 [Morganella morganii subsp. sibonii]
MVFTAQPNRYIHDNWLLKIYTEEEKGRNKYPALPGITDVIRLNQKAVQTEQ